MNFWRILTGKTGWVALAAAAAAVSLPLATAYGQQEPSRDVHAEHARTVPAWVRSGVIYQVWPRAFSAAGTLQGVTARLENLQKLDVNIVWLMPISPVGRLKSKGSVGSPYAVRDYYAIDPALGTADDLRQLITEAHRRNMKVILDIVANHTSWDSVMMAHPDFYKKDKNGQITYPYDWTDVAALDYRNPALRTYMTDMMVHWVKAFDVDGFRCDAAAEVPTSFWNSAAAAIRRAKPDVLLLAEAEKPDLMAAAFDLDYAWAGMHSLNEVVMNGAPATATLRGMLDKDRAKFPIGTLHMRMTDDHDELRAYARYGYPGGIAAWTVAATLEGVPLIWNGMEVGDTTNSAAPALFARQKIYWDAVVWHKEYPAYFTAINQLRRTHFAFQTGEAQWVPNTDEQHVVSYLRKDAGDTFLIEVNLSNTPFHGTVTAIAQTKWEAVPLPGFTGGTGSLTANATSDASSQAQTASGTFDLPAFGVKIFHDKEVASGISVGR